jgi:hypothetical protein
MKRIRQVVVTLVGLFYIGLLYRRCIAGIYYWQAT